MARLRFVCESRTSFFLNGSRPSPLPPIPFLHPPAEKSEWKRAAGAEGGNAELARRERDSFHALESCEEIRSHHARGARDQSLRDWKWVRANVRISPQQTMNIHLGTLEIVSATEHPELLAPKVAYALVKTHNADQVGVAEIDPQLSDTAAFCEHYQVRMDQAANCVVLETKRGEKTWFAACVVLGSTHADVNGLARRTLDARKVSFAPMEKAVAETEMEYGAITPIGLPESWSILIDKSVADAEYVIIGSGVRKSKLAVSGNFLASLPNVQVLDGLGQIKQSL